MSLEAYQRLMRVCLKGGLQQIADCDLKIPPDYATRYRLVLGAMHVAVNAGFQAGIRIDPKEPDWPVVYIELPTGQVSWHVPMHPIDWDGHSTHTKYERIREWQP